MPREPEQSDDRFAASDQVLDGDILRALLEEPQLRQRLALEEKYGPDVRLLAENDDKLLLYLESEDLSLKRVALFCLLHFHTVYPERIVRKAADYIVNGDDIEIRSLCVQYLSQPQVEEINSVLQDCASKLATREARLGDDVVLRVIPSHLKLIFGGPKSFADTAKAAETILARLKSPSEPND